MSMKQTDGLCSPATDMDLSSVTATAAVAGQSDEDVDKNIPRDVQLQTLFRVIQCMWFNPKNIENALYIIAAVLNGVSAAPPPTLSTAATHACCFLLYSMLNIWGKRV